MVVDRQAVAVTVLVGQQHAVVAQKEIVEEAVERDHRPAVHLGKFAASAQSVIGAINVAAFPAVKIELRQSVDAPHAVKKRHIRDRFGGIARRAAIGLCIAAAGGQIQRQQQRERGRQELFPALHVLSSVPSQ